MSLATRCTACGTVFRVVQDQLKVSEGWVRCGRCNEVFNALEGLFDLERDAPPEGVADHPPPPTAVPLKHADEEVWIDADPAASQPSLIDKIDAQLLGPRAREDRSTPATRISQRDRLEFPDARFDPDVLADGGSTADFADEPALLATEAELPPAPVEAPEFIQRAQRQARWQSAGMRASLGAGATVLVIALGLQAGHHFRDLVAARWPVAQPALAAWCGLWSCSIEAARRIEDVSVESSSLTRASTLDAFRLSVSLRNRSSMTLALPSVDLSLTDTTGQLVARRVLSPADFRSASAILAPGAEAGLQLTLSAGSARITGYTVEVFYP